MLTTYAVAVVVVVIGFCAVFVVVAVVVTAFFTCVAIVVVVVSVVLSRTVVLSRATSVGILFLFSQDENATATAQVADITLAIALRFLLIHFPPL